MPPCAADARGRHTIAENQPINSRKFGAAGRGPAPGATPPRIIPYLFYRDAPAALDFLSQAFGFREEMRHATPSGGVHGEASFGGQVVMLGQGVEERGLRSPQDAGGATMGVFLYLEDVDAHHAAAAAAGATIVHPPKDVPYGRTYAALDCEGHPWFFTTPAPPAA